MPREKTKKKVMVDEQEGIIIYFTFQVSKSKKIVWHNDSLNTNVGIEDTVWHSYDSESLLVCKRNILQLAFTKTSRNSDGAVFILRHSCIDFFADIYFISRKYKVQHHKIQF